MRPVGLPHDVTVTECTMHSDTHDKTTNTANFILLFFCVVYTVFLRARTKVVECKRDKNKLTVNFGNKFLLYQQSTLNVFYLRCLKNKRNTDTDCYLIYYSFLNVCFST